MSAYEAMKAAALAAQAERDALLSELHKANATIIDLQRIPPKFSEEYIAEIKAQAGRAGFLVAMQNFVSDTTSIEDEELADQYAESIRKGGE